MGKIAVHEFITLDGVIEEPRWTMDYPFDPKMGEAIGAIMGASEGLLLGRPHVRDVCAGVVGPDGRRRSWRSVHERLAQVRRLGHTRARRLEQLDDPRSLFRRM